MIITALCNTCYSHFQVRTEPEETDLLRELRDENQLAPCPRQCGGKILLGVYSDPTYQELLKHPALKAPVVITAKELYRAVKGAGLPDEIPTDPDALVAILKTYPVQNVVIQKDGRDIYLHELQLANDITVHLGYGRRGAQVVKVTKSKKGGPHAG